MKRILVPIDFSEYSEYALEVAAALAERFKTRLFLFHMIGINEAVLTKSIAQEQEEAKYYLKLAKQKLSKFLDRPYLQNVPIEAIVQNLRDFDEVIEVAKEKNIDLIVMGSHGTSGLKSFFVGSNTEKVVRVSTIPVLVIKSRHEKFDVKRMLWATDLKPETIPAYHKGKAFAKKLNAELDLVYVNTLGINFLSDAQIQEKIDGFNKIIGQDVPVKIYNDYTVEKGIFNYAKKMGANIVGIPTHGRKGLAHFFSGSIGENVVNTAQLPVLTFGI